MGDHPRGTRMFAAHCPPPLARKITWLFENELDRAIELTRRATGERLTRAELVTRLLCVQNLHTDDLTAEEVAEECRLSPWQVNAAARLFLRTGGREGLGPFRMFGRRRRFPRASVERWKQRQTVEVRP